MPSWIAPTAEDGNRPMVALARPLPAFESDPVSAPPEMEPCAQPVRLSAAINPRADSLRVVLVFMRVLSFMDGVSRGWSTKRNSAPEYGGVVRCVRVLAGRLDFCGLRFSDGVA